MKVVSNLVYDLRKNRVLLLMALPAIIFFFVFSYLPMAGIVMAFKRLDYELGIFNSPWVGFENFRFFFLSGQALKVTSNTALYNLAFIIWGTILQISLAIFLSEIGKKYFKKIAQTMMFLPYFISWVVVAAIAYNIFNYDFGALNTLLIRLGIEPIDVYGNAGVWKYILIFFNAWKYAGYGSVIYLAAIMSLDVEMYEAADIDGANVFQKMLKITLPCIKPTIIVLTLLSIGRIFKGDFDMFYQLIGTNGLLYNSTDVIDTFVFRSLLFTQEYGMGAAVGLFQSVLCFTVLVLTNYAIGKADKESKLF